MSLEEYKEKLIDAINDGDEEIIKHIINNQEKMNQLLDEYNQDPDFIPLHIAAQTGEIKILEMLMTKFDVNKKDVEGKTPIQYSIEEEKEECVKALIERNADLSLLSNDGRSPLHRAVENENEEITRLLLTNKSPINLMTNRDAWTCIHFASRMGYLEMVKILLEFNADINLKDKDDRTPLHLAAQMGFVDIVKLLLEKGANIDEINKQGRTPLHLASLMHLPVVKLLLKSGAKTDIQDHEGKTALQIAENRKEIVNYINKFENKKKEARGENSNPKIQFTATKEETEEILDQPKKSYSRKTPIITSKNGFSDPNAINNDNSISTNKTPDLDISSSHSGLSKSSVINQPKKSFLYHSWVPLTLLFGVSVAFGVYHIMKNRNGENYEAKSNNDFLIEEVNKK